jgi:O-succinylbenzoic acid--CoA ligase
VDPAAQVERLAGLLSGSGEILAFQPPPSSRSSASGRPADWAWARSHLEQLNLLQGAVIVPTSGSTGRPRPVVLSVPALRAAAHAAHDRLDGPGTWASALPTSYVAGLMTVVRAVVAGRRWRAVASDLSDLGVSGHGPHYVSIVPTQLYRALGTPAAAALATYDAVLVGGSRLDPALRSAAEAEGIRVVQTYGMSETSGGVVYDGVPLAGVAVGFVSWGGAADPGAGRIALTTPTCFTAYLGDPAATAAVLATPTGELQPPVGESRPPAGEAQAPDGESQPSATFITSDRGRWFDGRLVVTGRVDDVVQSGGVNVDLADLQGHVDAVCGAMRVAVYAVPDPVWGSRIMAAAIDPLTVADLIEHLGDRIAAAARPRGLVRVNAIPLTQSGKVDRLALARGEEQPHGDRR